MSARNRFSSSIENPLRTLRENLHFSQAQLARRLNVTPQVILLNEMGVYGTCNPSILEFLSDLSGESESTLSMQYDEWRVNAARYALGQAAHSVRDCVGSDFPHTPGHFNFEDVRNWHRFRAQFSSSLVGFCKIVKLQPSLVTAFESSNFRANCDSVLNWLEANSGVAHVD